MRPPTYRYVLCFSFYDGLEDGLAVEADGSGTRIWCLGDAGWTGSDDVEEDMHRAYLFERIGGNWLARVEACASEPCETRPGRFVWPAMGNQSIDGIERDAESAVPTSFFVALAHSYLDQMICVEIDAARAAAWRTTKIDPYVEVRDFVRAHAPAPR